MSQTLPQVSVIIVTHNSAETLGDCLEALRRAIADVNSELLVVDNASRDDSTSVTARLCPAATVLANDRNTGFAAAANQGAGEARGDYLLFLNPDVTPDPESVGRLLEIIAARDDAGLVSGRLRNPDGTFQATCRRFPTVGNILFSRGSFLSRWPHRRSKSSRYTLPDYSVTTPVEAVSGTMVMIRRDLFAKHGGFDRRFFMYMEDTDLSCRLHQNGRANLFVPAAGGVHRWGEGSKRGRLFRLWHHHLSVWKYFLKHIPNGFSVVVLPVLLGVNFVIQLFATSASERKRA